MHGIIRFTTMTISLNETTAFNVIKRPKSSTIGFILLYTVLHGTACIFNLFIYDIHTLRKNLYILQGVLCW